MAALRLAGPTRVRAGAFEHRVRGHRRDVILFHRSDLVDQLEDVCGRIAHTSDVVVQVLSDVDVDDVLGYGIPDSGRDGGTDHLDAYDVGRDWRLGHVE